LFGLNHIGATTFLIGAGLLGLSSALLVHMRLLMGVYNSEGRYSSGFLFITSTLTAQFAFTALAIALDAGPLIVAIVMLATQVAGLFLMRMKLFKIAPWLHIGISHYSRDKVYALAKPSFAGMAMPMGQAMTHSGIRIIIGIVLGPVAVVTFVAHRQMARLITFIGTFAQPFEVELSKIYGSGDMAKFINLSRMTIQLLFWALIGIALIAWLMSGTVFHLWLGNQMKFDATLFNLLLVVSLVEALWIITFSPTLAINQHMGPAKTYTLISIALLPLAYMACKQSGLYAIAGVLLAMEAIMLVAVVHKLLSLSGDRFWRWLPRVTNFPWRTLKGLGNLLERRA
jgi:O-antigen/teichoic acid export membrane protein